MKREFLVHKKTMIQYGFMYLILLLIPLSMFLINTDQFTTRNYVEVQGYYFTLYAVLIVVILSIPLLYKGNDNIHFYLARPVSRVRIMLDKYVYLFISGVIGALSAFLYFKYLMFLFLQSGMNGVNTGGGLDLLFSSVQWVVIFCFMYKILITTAFGIDLLSRLHFLFKILLPFVLVVLVFMLAYEFSIQDEIAYGEPLSFQKTTIVLIVIVIGSVLVDFYSFYKGEV